MDSLWLDIELLDDAAITESSATVGGHDTLGYLPGAVLLGAAARRCYPSGDDARAYRMFHAGGVRFGAALPLGPAGAVTVPMPLSLHHPKGDRAHVVNLARAAREAGVQYKQERTGFLAEDGHRVEPAQRSSMRTSIGANGRARDGFLYTITAIAAGTRFRARIDADEAQDLASVRDALLGGEIRVGRSRGAEFGRARVTAAETKPTATWQAGPAGRAVFLCLADLALRDRDTGHPTLVPEPADFGLPGWSWAPRLSFLRFRTYSPFNGFRRRPDLERQVIAAGSVLVFVKDGETADAAAVRAAIERGVGEHRGEGLGQVAFEPAMLRAERPVLLAKDRDATSVDAPAQAPGELGAWVAGREKERTATDAVWSTAMEWVKKLASVPMPAAQWGEVRALARRRHATSPKALAEELRQFLVEPPGRDDRRSVRHGDKRWGRRVRIDGASVKVGEWLVGELASLDGSQLSAARLLELVASHAVRARRGKEGR